MASASPSYMGDKNAFTALGEDYSEDEELGYGEEEYGVDDEAMDEEGNSVR